MELQLSQEERVLFFMCARTTLVKGCMIDIL